MAINSSHMRKKIEPKESYGTVSQASNVPSHVMTLTITTTRSSINSGSRCRIARKKKLTSPYLTDRVKLPRVTEKKMSHKKPIAYGSPLPLSTNVYKANSDELRSSKRPTKKVKKSVLTLPNESSNDGIVCTVSDANEVTEYNKEKNRAHKTKTRKRLPIQNKKARIRDKNYEYYDRDARYYTQMNIDLDCSSTDLIKTINGDGGKASNKNTVCKVSETESKLDPHDVWAVLRNINRFQFTPSPPMSDFSIQSRKKKRIGKNRNTRIRKDPRVFETCHTEEFAYISSYDLNRTPPNFSPISSIDRITVIEKQDEFKKLYQAFEKRFETSRGLSEPRKVRAENKLNLGSQNINNRKSNKIIKPNSKLLERNNNFGRSSVKKPSLNTFIEDQHDEVALEYIDECYDTAPLCLLDNDDIKEKIDDINIEAEVSPHNETISVNSGSSKAGLHDFVTKTKDKLKPVQSDEFNQQLKGITKVVVSKAPEGTTSKRGSTPVRKPRLVTTMPSTTITPKLTQTEIKRRLANIKYPIVILEKDELGCSSIEIPPFENIQFRGLSNHIWPFMKDWHDISKDNVKNNNSNAQDSTHQEKGKRFTSKLSNNTNSPENKIASKDRKFYMCNTKKTDTKRMNTLAESKNIIETSNLPTIPTNQTPTKPKTLKLFKDKMLKLLYKKSVEDLIHHNNQTNQTGGQGDIMKQRILQNTNPVKLNAKINTGTETGNISLQENPVPNNERLIESAKIKESMETTLPRLRHPWAREKWTSNFIDSVIKKIKTGIYYSQENKILCKRCCKELHSKEASIQTTLSMSSLEDLNINKAEDRNATSDSKIIPGFDDALTPVEIKSLNTKQITIKHCLTNVLLQFDVAIPTDKQPLPCEAQKSHFTPLVITEGNTKIIKCKSTILNAIMPAELCSIIPKIMRTISDFNTSFYVTYPPILPKKPECQLATITELIQPSSIDSLNYSITPFTFMSVKLKTFLAGKFLHNVFDIQNKSIVGKITNIAPIRNVANLNEDFIKDIDLVPVLLLHIHSLQHIFYANATDLTRNKLSNLPLKIKEQSHEGVSQCMALQPYVAPKQYIAPSFGVHNVIKLLQDICFNNIVVNFDFPKYCPMRLSDIKLTIHRNLMNGNKVQDVISVPKNELDSIFLKTNDHRSQQNGFRTVKCIEYDERATQIQEKKRNQNLCHIKAKKRYFVRLYKKCKSTSNIAMERSSIALNKITNLDQFFQVLGSGKLLSSVFDGYSEKKILSSIAEMKSWITDITQRQAMLVLLLTNKKDTPNLVRYRPVLLQGIAVNRITRASELDMEIEVIETENLHKLSQYEGISRVSATTQNNNLLEELYWIAKTTASDYQKPFDESSERLLKSLTEKRKRLNPSYLRVMARYVGLGLLKPPKKSLITA